MSISFSTSVSKAFLSFNNFKWAVFLDKEKSLLFSLPLFENEELKSLALFEVQKGVEFSLLQHPIEFFWFKLFHFVPALIANSENLCVPGISEPASLNLKLIRKII